MKDKAIFNFIWKNKWCVNNLKKHEYHWLNKEFKNIKKIKI